MRIGTHTHTHTDGIKAQYEENVVFFRKRRINTKGICWVWKRYRFMCVSVCLIEKQYIVIKVFSSLLCKDI